MKKVGGKYSIKRSIITIIAIIAALFITAISASAASEEYPAISCDTETEVYLNGTDITEKTFSFTPTEDGNYVFYSYGENDTYGYILDGNEEVIFENDDTAGNRNFKIAMKMTKGTTYLLRARFFDTSIEGAFWVKVEKCPTPTSIAIEGEDVITSSVGENQKLKVTFEPENAFTSSIEWSSDKPEIASVNEDGEIWLLSPGKATITAKTNNGVTDSVTINVVDVTDITPEQSVKAEFKNTTSTTLRFTVEEDGWYGFFGTVYELDVWAYLKILGYGSMVAKPAENDSFYIQYEFDAGQTYYLLIENYNDITTGNVDVTLKKLAPPTEVKIDYSGYDAYVGEKLTIEPTFAPQYSVQEKFTLESSDSDIIYVDYIDSSWQVNFVGVGTATVKITTDSGLTASCDITVSTPVEIERCKTVALDMTKTNDFRRCISFTPEKSGKYLFYSDTSCNPYATLYEDAALSTEIGYADDENGTNFYLYQDLTAGKTYYLVVEIHDDSETTVDVSVVLSNENGYAVHETDGYAFNKETHTFYCSTCEATKTEPHELDDNLTCVCGYTHKHNIEDWQYEEETHYGYCPDCSHYTEDVAHEFDDSGNCVCGYFEHEHEISQWYANGESHYGPCDKCDLSMDIAHTFEEDICTECGYFVHEHVAYFWQADGENNHKSECAFCDTYIREAHDIDENGYCSECGYCVNHTHISEYWEIDTDYHSGWCEICEEYVYAEHEYDEDTPCVCGYYEHEHVSKNGYDTYSDVHGSICTICKAEFYAKHEFDENGKCECGYYEHEHKYELLKYDEYEHWAYCLFCDESTYDYHSYENDEKCICGYYEHEHAYVFNYNNLTHWAYCSICKLYVEDYHTMEENGACICGYSEHEHERTEIEILDNDSHTYICTVCNTIFAEDHEFDSSDKCVCGYEDHEHTAKSYTYDKNYHYAYCDICNFDIRTAHRIGENKKCECGYESHVHTFTEYTADYIGHNIYCEECNATAFSDMTEHVYAGGEKCIVCAYEKTVVVYIGGVLLENGKYIDGNGNVTTSCPSGGYAYLKDGVLTVSNLTVNMTEADNERNEAIYSDFDIELIIIGKNNLYSAFDDAIYIDGDLKISGSGSVEIFSDESDGIDVEGSLIVESGIIFYIDAGDNAIEVDYDVTVNGGTFRLWAMDDGFNVDGDVTVNGGVIYVTSEDKGIYAGDGSLTINGGSIYVYSEKATCVWVEESFFFNGGCLYTESVIEGILSDYGKVYLNGGYLKISVKTENHPAILSYGKIILPSSVSGYGMAFSRGDHFTLTKDAKTVTTVELNLDGKSEMKPIEKDGITVKGEAVYEGSATSPKITVTDENGKTLTEGTDYVVYLPFGGISSVGTYEITVAGIGDYYGTRTFTLTVTEPESDTTVDDGLSTATIVLISVGGAVVLLAGIFSLYLFVIRKKKTPGVESSEDNAQ